MTSSDTIKTGSIGMIASAITWAAGAVNWYKINLPSINDWLVHFAQIGGLIVMYFTIRILRRNWKQGLRKHNPLD